MPACVRVRSASLLSQEGCKHPTSSLGGRKAGFLARRRRRYHEEIITDDEYLDTAAALEMDLIV